MLRAIRQASAGLSAVAVRSTRRGLSTVSTPQRSSAAAAATTAATTPATAVATNPGVGLSAGARKRARDANKPRLSRAELVERSRQVTLMEFSKTRPEVFDTSERAVRDLKLNRPHAMNALTLSMIRRLKQHLIGYERNPMQAGSVLTSVSAPKVFCAGGDVKSLCEYVMRKRRGLPPIETEDISREFFREEYQLNYMMSILAKPYIPVMDGVTMGGGVGISVHSPYCVATENTLFAMPETAIGFFPDVGASFFLPRLPFTGMGLFLALTGYRLKGADVLHAGIASHYMPSDSINIVIDRIADSRGGREIVENALEAACVEPNDDGLQFGLEPHLETIWACFADVESVEEVIARLSKHATDSAATEQKRTFCKSLVDALALMSPTALKVTFEQLRRGEYMSLENCLKMEYRMSQHFMAGHDFVAGVNHKLITKSKGPVQWSPATLKEVTSDMVNSYFAPVPVGDVELELPTEYDLQETPGHRTSYLQWNTTPYTPPSAIKAAEKAVADVEAKHKADAAAAAAAQQKN